MSYVEGIVFHNTWSCEMDPVLIPTNEFFKNVPSLLLSTAQHRGQSSCFSNTYIFSEEKKNLSFRATFTSMV